MPDYVKIHIPKNEDNEMFLDELMEAEDILSYEGTVYTLSVLGLWDDKERLYHLINSRIAKDQIESEHVPDQDWNKKWVESFKPIRIGDHFCVTPPWHHPKLAETDHKIIINPGQAFGTGTHESSQLVLMLMERYPPLSKKVLDIGCGSGILSIGASQLGAHSIIAVDYDPVFMDNMSENLNLNDIKNVKHSVDDIFLMTTFPGDYIIMNIEKHIILPALKKISDKDVFFPELFLSGLLVTDLGEVKETLNTMGYQLMDSIEKGEWIGLYFIHKG